MSLAAFAAPSQRLVGLGLDGTQLPNGRVGHAETVDRDARTSWSRRLLLLVYWGGAIALVPWIVTLQSDQPANAVVYHLSVLLVGASAFLIAGMLATAYWSSRDSHLTVVAGTFTATVAFMTAWFSMVSTSGAQFTLALAYGLGMHVPVIIVCAWMVRRQHHHQHFTRRPPAMIARVLIIGAIAFVPLTIAATWGAPSSHAAHHLGLTWVGLDVFELIGMATAGWCLRRRLPSLAVAATLTGTLMLCDAWYDVVTTVGSAKGASVALACLELPLAALSIAVARHEVLRWPDVSHSAPSVAPRMSIEHTSQLDADQRPHSRAVAHCMNPEVQPSSIWLSPPTPDRQSAMDPRSDYRLSRRRRVRT